MDEALAQAWEEAEEGLILHQDRRVLYLNPKAAELLGVDRGRVLGQPLLLALRDHRLEALALLGGERSLEVRGRVLWARARPGRLYLLDETEKAQRVREVEEEKRLLAHELRTPLAGMGALLEALSPRTPEEAQVLDLLKGEVGRLTRLVQGLGERKRVWTVPEELWPRLQALLGPRLAGRRVLAQAGHPVPADPEGLFQVLLNLLDNALKYGRDPIRLQTWQEGGWVGLEVRDQGPPLGDYGALWEAGGLGLPLVRRLARAWGGEAYAERKGEENAFGLRWPLH